MYRIEERCLTKYALVWLVYLYKAIKSRDIIPLNARDHTMMLGRNIKYPTGTKSSKFNDTSSNVYGPIYFHSSSLVSCFHNILLSVVLVYTCIYLLCKSAYARTTITEKPALPVRHIPAIS